jgi:hypothetical protein
MSFWITTLNSCCASAAAGISIEQHSNSCGTGNLTAHSLRHCIADAANSRRNVVRAAIAVCRCPRQERGRSGLPPNEHLPPAVLREALALTTGLYRDLDMGNTPKQTSGRPSPVNRDIRPRADAGW